MNVLENIAKLCTTPMGVDRIRKNIGLGDVDVVEYCKSIIQNLNCVIYRQGKNWYCELDGERITVNAKSFTIDRENSQSLYNLFGPSC